MTDILKKIYTEIVGGTDTSLLIWTLIGFFIIILVSRKIGKIKLSQQFEDLSAALNNFKQQPSRDFLAFSLFVN